MEEPKRQGGRPKKHIGLSTPQMLKQQVANGAILRDVRSEESKPEGPVLPQAPASRPPQVRGGRIFGTASGDHPERPRENLQPPLLNANGRSEENANLTFTDLLKKVALEIAPEEFQDVADGEMTGMELLARKVFYSALSERLGSQRARELVVERLEGKAVRAAQVQTPDTSIEDQIDKAALNLLNELADPQKEA